MAFFVLSLKISKKSATAKDITTKATTYFSDEEALVQRVIFDGESPSLILNLFTYPEKTQRIKIGLAFAAVNVEFTHNEESGFAEKRSQFWKDVEQHLPDIENALFEALIATAENGTSTRIPYTLAWMPGQDHETVEVFGWAAKHHPDYWVRRFSIYFVSEFGSNKSLARTLLSDGVHDPHYAVRKLVLALKWNQFTGGLWS